MACGQLIEMIFSDELRICIVQGNEVEYFVWGHSNKTYEDDCLKKTSRFPKSFMISDCMSFKGPIEMVIIISTINVLVYIEILDNFLISSIENWFGDDEIIF